MKRNMDLIRRILFEMEKQPFPMRNKIGLPIEGYSPDEITYHIVLLIEADLILGYDVAGKRYPKRLTWAGHEFLEASRDEGRWKKAKTIMADKAGGFSFDVAKSLLIQFMKDAVLGT